MKTASSSRVSRPAILSAALTGAAFLVLSLVVSTDAATPVLPDTADQTVPAGDIARGEYIVNSVAMCVQCHSPRDEAGNIIENRKLTGAPMPVRGPMWSPSWAYSAPPIARLTGFTDEQVMALLTVGRATDRPSPKPPMPPFRMSREDAAAVIAYLRSR